MKKRKQKSVDDIIDEMNLVSATEYTGMIPANPEQAYEDEEYEADERPDSIL